MVRVLLVEDHQDLVATLVRGLSAQGLSVDAALSGEEGLERATVNDYDVIVLDRDLPGMSGDELCRTLAGAGALSRILMLTAASTIDDRVEGLGLGADDYLTKPFAFAELVARIRALARRARPALPPTLAFGDLRLDPAHRVATRGGLSLALSPREFAVLEELMAAQGSVVSAETLLDRVWGEAADLMSTAVKVTINRLRGKLGTPGVIEHVPHAGYRLASPP